MHKFRISKIISNNNKIMTSLSNSPKWSRLAVTRKARSKKIKNRITTLIFKEN